MLPLLLAGACAPALPPPCTSCELGDENNFSYEADLGVQVVPVRASSDLSVEWSALSMDIHGHTRRPAADFDAVWAVAFPSLSPAEVAEALAADRLDQSDVGGFASCATAATHCLLSDFGLGGREVGLETWLTEGSATWLLYVTSPLEAGGQGLVFVEPRDDAASERVSITTASSRLQVDVDLETLAPVVVPAGEPALRLDWTAVTRDGLGNEVYLPALDQLEVARFDERLEDLEGRVFDLEERASAYWSMSLDGSGVAELSALQGDEPFDGIDEASTWLVAVRCTLCMNPSPRIATVLLAGEG